MVKIIILKATFLTDPVHGRRPKAAFGRAATERAARLAPRERRRGPVGTPGTPPASVGAEEAEPAPGGSGAPLPPS